MKKDPRSFGLDSSFIADGDPLPEGSKELEDRVQTLIEQGSFVCEVSIETKDPVSMRQIFYRPNA